MMAPLEVLWMNSGTNSRGTGLHLNLEMTEVICHESSTQEAMLQHVPSLCVFQREHATLLGSQLAPLKLSKILSVPRRNLLKFLESGSCTQFMHMMLKVYAYCGIPSPSLNCSCLIYLTMFPLTCTTGVQLPG